ncbi:unnamed protein product, partial [Polarella glacialis]
APPLLDLERMAPRKLRVLALCGGHSCAAVLRVQTTALRLALGKDVSEWTFLEGSEDWTHSPGEPVISEMEEKLAQGSQLKNWYMDSCEESGGVQTGRTNREKQFDRTTRVFYQGIPAAVERLRRQVMDAGPFDVLVAFSQGTVMAHLLIGHLRREAPGVEDAKRWHCTRNGAEQMPWEISVFFNGMHVRDEDYFHLFEQKSPHPTVHVFGREDEFYDYGRDGFGNQPQ